MELAELQKIASQAREACREAKNTCDAEARKAADEVSALHAAHIDELNRVACEAESAVRAEQDRLARSKTNTKYPVGTVLVEWKAGTSILDRKRRPTGRKGLWEVCTKQSRFRENSSFYSRPNLGEEFVRVLKKDGTPSLLFVDGWNATHEWHPEGVSPNEVAACPSPTKN